MRGVYVSETGGPNSRGRPLGRRKDRIKEYMCEKGVCETVGASSRGKPLGRRKERIKEYMYERGATRLEEAKCQSY